MSGTDPKVPLAAFRIHSDQQIHLEFRLARFFRSYKNPRDRPPASRVAQTRAGGAGAARRRQLIFGDYLASRLGAWMSLGALSPRQAREKKTKRSEADVEVLVEAKPRLSSRKADLSSELKRDFYHWRGLTRSAGHQAIRPKPRCMGEAPFGGTPWFHVNLLTCRREATGSDLWFS